MIEGLLRPQHILVILSMTSFFFGGKKLSALGKGLGDGLRSFKDSFKSVDLSAGEENPAKPKEA